jgi:hypothetical protein
VSRGVSQKIVKSRGRLRQVPAMIKQAAARGDRLSTYGLTCMPNNRTVVAPWIQTRLFPLAVVTPESLP